MRAFAQTIGLLIGSSTIAAALLLLVLLSGCAQMPGPVSVIAEKPAPIRMAPECTTTDPAWADVPDRDVKRSELARLWSQNKKRYRTVIVSRRVCRSSIEAARRAS